MVLRDAEVLGNDCEPLALLSAEPGAQRLPSC